MVTEHIFISLIPVERPHAGRSCLESWTRPPLLDRQPYVSCLAAFAFPAEVGGVRCNKALKDEVFGSIDTTLKKKILLLPHRHQNLLNTGREMKFMHPTFT
jgi:hypothetical protein